MPEIAEVETERRKIEKVLKNQRIVDVEAARDPIVFERNTDKMVQAKLTGRTVKGSGRRGKYFWLIMDKKPYPVFHFGMSGYTEIVDKGVEYKRNSLRLTLILKNGKRVLFYDPRRFSRIRFSADPENEAPISLLGPDPLIDFPTAKELHTKLAKRKAPIKAVLLDQTLFAGVGNWVADEVLFQARLNPHRLANDLSAKEVAELRRKLLQIVKTAVKVGADYEKFPRGWLFNHRWGKRKDSKTANGHKVIHSTIGGRTTAWVEGWQR